VAGWSQSKVLNAKLETDLPLIYQRWSLLKSSEESVHFVAMVLRKNGFASILKDSFPV
jgi:hypothetical protein